MEATGATLFGGEGKDFAALFISPPSAAKSVARQRRQMMDATGATIFGGGDFSAPSTQADYDELSRANRSLASGSQSGAVHPGAIFAAIRNFKVFHPAAHHCVVPGYPSIVN